MRLALPLAAALLLAACATATPESTLPKDAIVSELVRLVPSFQHVETGKSLDQKM